MKKRGMAFVLVMVLSICMMFAGCSQKENPFVGTWKASYDLTKEIADSLEGYEDCFKDLKLVMVLEFDEEEIQFYLDEKEMDVFMDNYKTGMITMLDMVLEEQAKEANLSVEETLAALGVTHDEYIEEFLSQEILDAYRAEIEESFGEKIVAEYKYTNSKITLDHEEGIEIRNYELNEGKLTIDMGDDFVLTFEK